MNKNTLHKIRSTVVVLGMILALVASAFPGIARAAVLPASTCTEASGIRSCDLWAKTGTLSLPGGGSATMWGYALDSLSPAELPGPVLIANSGETLQITLHNGLGESSSLSIPGLSGPSDRVGASSGGTKLYSYANLQAGTYIYQAGPTANGERQVALGMYGVLIVRPAGSPLQAYGPASAFNDEAVLVMSEFDTLLAANPTGFNMREYKPRYYLFNGKGYPNTANIDTSAGNKVLLRLVNAGIKSRSLGVLGLRYSVLSMDGSPLAHPYSAVAETLGAGQTADIMVSIPATALVDQKYAMYDSSLRLLNNNARFGGMLTFLNVTAGGSGSGDTTGPTTSGLSLAPNPSNGTSNVTFNATVSDAATGGANISAAEYFLDSVGASGSGTAMSASDALFDSVTEAVTAVIDPTSISSGSHNVYIHGQDSNGNWGAFTSIALVLDKAGPVVSGLLANPNPSSGTVAIALSGTANDSASGNSIVTAVEYFIDAPGANGSGTPMSMNQTSPTVAITGSISAGTMSGLSEGYHWVHVHALDAMGNWGAFTQLQIGVDKTGPATSGIQIRPNPNNGALPYTPSIQSVRVDATFTEPGAGPIASTVQNAEFFIDSACVNGTGILMTPSDGLFNSATENGYAYIPLTTINTLTDGDHVFSFHGRDAAGNWGPCSTGILTIDKTPPTFSGISLSPNTIVAGTASVNLDVNGASDAGGTGVTGGEYWFGTTVPAPGGGTAFSGTSISIPTGTLSAGTHTVSVRIRDAVGNWSTTFNSATLTVTATSNTLYFSTTGNVNPPGVGGTADNADIYYWNGSAFSRVIDASGAGSLGLPGGANVDGFARVDATHFYMSFTGNVTIPRPGPDLSVADEDVVYYNAGTWSLFFDGSANGLGGTDLGAISLSGGTLYFSTNNTAVPPGAGGTGDNSDVYRWNGGSSYTRMIDASALGWSTANIDGLKWVDATHIYLSYSADTSVAPLGAFQDEDIVYYNNGVWSVYFDGTALGLTNGGHDINAFDLP